MPGYDEGGSGQGKGIPYGGQIRTKYDGCGGRPVTLLDTQGHVDFAAEMERTLPVLDYVVLVVSGSNGVQGHTETLWRLLSRYEVPVFLFVNKMDLAGCDEALLAVMVQMEPARIVYVSCDSATLARDLKYLCGAGYGLERVQPVDMFPMTVGVETIVLLSHKSPDKVINVTVEFGEGEGKVPLDAMAERAKKYQPKPKVTYKMIQEYVEKKYGFKVHTAYIAEVKRSLGLTMYDAPNAVEELKYSRKLPTKEKVKAITDALKYFEVI